MKLKQEKIKFGLAILLLLLFLPIKIQAEDLPPLPADSSLEDPSASDFSNSDIFFDNFSLDNTTDSTDAAANDNSATTTDSATNETSSTSQATETEANAESNTTAVTDTASGLPTAWGIGLAGGLAILSLIMIKQFNIRHDK